MRKIYQFANSPGRVPLKDERPNFGQTQVYDTVTDDGGHQFQQTYVGDLHWLSIMAWVYGGAYLKAALRAKFILLSQVLVFGFGYWAGC